MSSTDLRTDHRRWKNTSETLMCWASEMAAHDFVIQFSGVGAPYKVQLHCTVEAEPPHLPRRLEQLQAAVAASPIGRTCRRSQCLSRFGALFQDGSRGEVSPA